MEVIDFLNEKDRYARTNGMQLTELRADYARAEMVVEERHLNGGNVCQGGAMFTLADLAVAGLFNANKQLTVSIESQITFHSAGQLGDRLIAEAVMVKEHGKLPYARVSVSKEDGELVASFTCLGYRKKVELF